MKDLLNQTAIDLFNSLSLLKEGFGVVIEVDYTSEELEKVERLRKHFIKNPLKDVRDYFDAVKSLFPEPSYIVGSGNTHIWVNRKTDINIRLLYIGSISNCEFWTPKIEPNIILLDPLLSSPNLQEQAPITLGSC
jgi:hypothetical protein